MSPTRRGLLKNKHHDETTISLNVLQHEPSSSSSASSSQEEEDDDATLREQRDLRFAGVARLYADDTQNNEHNVVLNRLTQSTVVVVGLGGVGSWAAEALCRSGVGNLVLIDLDDICISNTNRQSHATIEAYGTFKIDAIRQRLQSINPQCNVTNVYDFVSTTNVHDLLTTIMEQHSNRNNNNKNNLVVLDAMDSSIAKVSLIAACVQLGQPIVTCGAAAGKRDATQITTSDLVRVHGDLLLRSVRTNLRRFHPTYFPQGIKGQRKSQKWKITAVYSSEEQKDISYQDETVGAFRRCDGALGTACFVTGTVGFVAAGQVVEMLADDNVIIPRNRCKR